MTNRDFFNSIASNENLSDELRTFASEAIAKMDARNAKRSSKPSKKALVNEPIKASIIEFLGTHTSAPAADIAAALDITTQKASALCRQLVENGLVDSAEIKIPKKGKVKAYSVHIAE